MIAATPALDTNPASRQFRWAAGAAALAVALSAVLLATAIASYVRTGDGIGGDFLTDYAGGYLVRTGAGERLYDLEAQEAAQRDLSPGGADDDVNPFVAPPIVAWAFAPLSAVPYRAAHVIFTVANIIALAGAALLLRRELADAPSRLRNALLAAFALSMPAITNLSWGQIDLVLVYAALLGWRFLREDRDVLAGAALSLALLKPHFVVGFVLLLIVQRRWVSLATMATMALPVLVLPAIALGPEALRDYAGLVTGATHMPPSIDTQPQHMANWRGFVTGLVNRDDAAFWLPGAAIVAIGALALAVWVWLREPRSARSFALACALPLLLSPHVHMQSMMVLFVALGLMAQSGVRDISLGGGRRLDGAAAALWLLAALFAGWFLTANEISVMVFLSGGVFAWCALGRTPTLQTASADDSLRLAEAA
jgi:hypothetical protein